MVFWFVTIPLWLSIPILDSGGMMTIAAPIIGIISATLATIINKKTIYEVNVKDWSNFKDELTKVFLKEGWKVETEKESLLVFKPGLEIGKLVRPVFVEHKENKVKITGPDNHLKKLLNKLDINKGFNKAA